MGRNDYGKQIEKEMTEAVLAAIEEGDLPWTKPWVDGRGPPLINTSVNGHAYRGMNQLWLTMVAQANGWMTPQWGTFKAWKSKGYSVQKGQSGTKVVFIRYNWKTETDAAGKETSRFCGMTYKVWTVFNREQTDAPPMEQPEAIPEEEYTEAVLNLYETLGVKWQQGGNRAYYSQTSDSITLPVMDAFNSQADWASVALHELAHWTGHNTRIDRLNMGTWGDDRYAFEELIAETASAFLCGILGVPLSGLQHTEYLATWGRRIKADESTLRKAMGAAWKAVDFILDGPQSE